MNNIKTIDFKKYLDAYTDTNGLYPGELMKIGELFMREIEKAIKEINEDPKKAADESFDIMGQTPEAVEKFLGRVSFDFKSGLEY